MTSVSDLRRQAQEAFAQAQESLAQGRELLTRAAEMEHADSHSTRVGGAAGIPGDLLRLKEIARLMRCDVTTASRRVARAGIGKVYGGNVLVPRSELHRLEGGDARTARPPASTARPPKRK